MKDGTPSPRPTSYRWLMGEDVHRLRCERFVTCGIPPVYGHPGKVTTPIPLHHRRRRRRAPQLRVPNHGYSLLVDGGVFNNPDGPPVSVSPRLRTSTGGPSPSYQTPATDFSDHADALHDLLRRPDRRAAGRLSTAGCRRHRYADPPDPIMAAGDCAQVDDMIAAVELRTDPVQCNFQPLLKPGGPSLCGTGFSTKTATCPQGASRTAWPGGHSPAPSFLGGLIPSLDLASRPAGGQHGTRRAPAGGTARGVGDRRGQRCSGAAGDSSTWTTIISPTIGRRMPAT